MIMHESTTAEFPQHSAALCAVHLLHQWKYRCSRLYMIYVYGAVPAAVLKLAAVLIGICAGSVKLLYIKFILIGLSGYGDHDSGVTFGSNC